MTTHHKERQTPTPHHNFFIHAYNGFIAQPLPTKLFLIALVLLALTLPAILSPILVKADSYALTLIPTDDAHVNKSSKTNNYGPDKEVKSDGDRMAYMKFNLSSLANQPVSKAELRFYVSGSTKSVHVLKNVPDTSWSEKTLTYNNRPLPDSSIIASINGAPSGQWKTVDVTNSVIANLGKVWSYSIENTGTPDSLHFYSKDNKTRKPELVVQFSTGAPPTAAPSRQPTPSPVVPTPLPTVTRVVTAGPSPTRAPTATRPPATPTRVASTATIAPATPTNLPPGTATLPSQVLNLTNWKITLPTGPEESPTEIKQPELANFQVNPWFIVNSTKNGVVFRAPVNGVTTSGSGYPRSELREMKNNGRDQANWSTSDGLTHTMIVDEAFTAIPKVKKHVVGSQIHDGGDDVIVIRLEHPKLFIDIAGNDGPVLDANYALGRRFTVKYVVSNNQTKIYYNGATTPIYTLNKSYSGAYFKAGAYTQSKCTSTGGVETDCSANNYGEVVVYGLTVTHQ